MSQSRSQTSPSRRRATTARAPAPKAATSANGRHPAAKAETAPKGRHAAAKATAARRRRVTTSATAVRDRDTEQTILDAAHAVFTRRGTAGARMQDIATEAGVNQALLHYYFRSKDRLADAVFRRAAAGLLPRVIDVMASDLSLEQKVAQVVRIELDHLARTPYLPGYIISELHHHPERVHQLLAAATGMTADVIGPKVFPRLRDQLEAGVKARTLRPIPPEQFIVNLLSLCIFPFAARPMLMALFGLDERGFRTFIDQRREQLADFVLRAIRP